MIPLQLARESISIAKALRTIRRRKKLAALDCVVVSPGGTATTAICSYLANYRVTNDPGDPDGLKHSPEPPAVSKIIFLKDINRRSCASLHRRNYLRANCLKLGGGLRSIFVGQRELFATWEVLVERQERRFLELPAHRCLVIPTVALPNSGKSIANFLEIESPDFLTNFPIHGLAGSGDTMSAGEEI